MNDNFLASSSTADISRSEAVSTVWVSGVDTIDKFLIQNSSIISTTTVNPSSSYKRADSTSSVNTESSESSSFGITQGIADSTSSVISTTISSEMLQANSTSSIITSALTKANPSSTDSQIATFSSSTVTLQQAHPILLL